MHDAPLSIIWRIIDMTKCNDELTHSLNRRNFMQVLASVAAIAPIGIGSALAQDTPAPTKQNSSKGRFISIDGNRVYIEDRGEGIPIIMAAGGQNIVETLRPMAEQLAKKYRVITWDRANLGRSDVVLKGARDLDMWSDQLAGIIDQLGLRPAYLVGASSAARVAYTTALRYPDHTRGLLTYLTTGGGNIGERLAEGYYYNFAKIAEEGGMEAIIKAPFWADRIAHNPNNKQRLLSINAEEFATTMRRWGGAMRSSDVMIGFSEGDCSRLKENGTPAAIVQGCEESPVHRKDRSELFAKLTGAELILTPTGYCEEATTGPKYEELMLRPEVPESPEFRAYEMLTMMPDVIDQFIQKTEAGYRQRHLGSDAFSFAASNTNNNEGENKNAY
jgi:pimeloyl-ACP methyl ester carboxylesterase